MLKKRIFTPGPTPIPEQVMLAMAEPLIHHRSPEFKEILGRVNKNLQYVFQTGGPVLTLACSGTGGVESTFVSLFSPGDTVISVNSGKFGARWVEMPRVFGIKVAEIKVEWGRAADAGSVMKVLKEHPHAKAVYLTHTETSTGTRSDIESLSGAIRENSDALVCVDAISSIGVEEFQFDKWGIDVCVTGSQKGLMVPPGLAFVALSGRAMKAMDASRVPKFYFDLKKALRSHEKNDTPWTPSISLIRGTDAALQMIKSEGIENTWKRHSKIASAVRSGLKSMGLELFSQQPSNALTAVWVPQNIQWQVLNGILKESYGITLAGGQEAFIGRLFRISHMGYFDEMDAIGVLYGLEAALSGCGFNLEIGSGISAAQEVLSANWKNP